MTKSAWRLLVLAVSLCIFACEPPASPQLIQLSDVTPHELEVSDKLEIGGSGFPEGRTARVVFRGDLHRAGTKVISHVSVETEGVARSGDRVVVAVTDSLETLFCGALDSALHTTFEGEIEVAFRSANPGAPPIAGVLPRVVLDFNPSPPSVPTAHARATEGTEFLRRLGLGVQPSRSGRVGLAVNAVAPNSRAAQAGLAVGDTIVRINGVRAVALADALPAPGERETSFAWHRPGESGERFRAVNTADLTGRAEGWNLFFGLLAAAIGLALLACVPASAMVFRFQRRLVLSLRQRRGALLRMKSRRGLFVGALLLALPVLHFATRAGIDLALIGGAALALAAFANLVRSSSERPKGFRRGARRVAILCLYVLPSAVGLADLVVVSGSLRVREAVLAQGASPWEWGLVRAPLSVIVLALLLSVVLIRVDGHSRDESRAEWCWDTAAAILSATVVATFFGGWLLPGVSPVQQFSSVPLRLIGTLLFAAKAAALFAGLRILRGAMLGVDRDSPSSFFGRVVLPGAALSPFLLILWNALRPSETVQVAISAIVLGALCWSAILFTLRLRHHFSVRTERHLNAFL